MISLECLSPQVGSGDTFKTPLSQSLSGQLFISIFPNCLERVCVTIPDLFTCNMKLAFLPHLLGIPG